MKYYLRHFLLLAISYAFCSNNIQAQNPFIRDQFTADPSARVFGDRVYVYPSHDILATPGRGRVGWFCMEDYHVFSSTDLANWTDHGMIVSQNKVPWVDSNSFSMWAPDCIERNGKYYFYFPSRPKDTTEIKGFTIGVAVADHPAGPFVPEATPIKKIRGIDPNVFIDKDGQAYLYWSQGHIYGAKLKENMLELDGDPIILQDLPEKGLKEGPYLFERNGIYYLTYPHVENKTERLEYAISDNPLGPFKFTGVIMDESPTGCWTNHQSIIQFNQQWYLFYHHNDYSPKFDKARSIRIDSLFFDGDGSIKKVKPTLRGVGLSKADSEIQIDRYSAISEAGASIEFLDTAQRFKGWKTILANKGAWVRYNSVDFSGASYKTVIARVLAKENVLLELRQGRASGPLLATFLVPAGVEWKKITTALQIKPQEVQHLVLVSASTTPIEIDWIQFK